MIAVLGTVAVVGLFNLSSIVDILKSNALSVVVFALSERIKLLLPFSVKSVFAEILIDALFTSHKTSFLLVTLAKFLVKLDAVPKYDEAASGIAGRYPKIAGSCADSASKKKPKTHSPTLGVPYRFGAFKG